MPRLIRATLAAALLLPLTAAFADDSGRGCALQNVAALDIIPNNIGSVLVPVELDGKPAALALDTGGVWGVLRPAAIEGLQQHRALYTVGGMAGKVLRSYVSLPSLRIGALQGKDVEFFAGGDRSTRNTQLAGTLGANVLKDYDVEIDPRLGKVNFFMPNDCKGSLAYWNQADATTIPFDLEGNAIVLPVILDGKPIRALLDTGSTTSVLDWSMAQALFGLTPESAGVDDVGATVTPSGESVRIHSHTFKSLQIGNVTFNDPVLTLGRNELYRHGRDASGFTEPPLLLGMHELRLLHLYIAYHQHKLYLSSVQSDAVRAAGNDAATMQPPASPKTADILDQQAARKLWQSAKTHFDKQEYELALKDLDRAMALIPPQPGLYLAHARLQIARKAYPQAVDDLNHAIALDGGNAAALFERAQVYAAMHDKAHALQDIEQTLALDPSMPKVHLQRAALYLNEGDAAKALPDLDAEIKLRPDSIRAHAGRCWALAMLQRNRDALAECDLAIAADANDVQSLYARAVANLNLQADAAAIRDYTAVLQHQPQRADALYGRGLARRKSGDAAGARADMAAAIQLDPSVSRHFTVTAKPATAVANGSR